MSLYVNYDGIGAGPRGCLKLDRALFTDVNNRSIHVFVRRTSGGALSIAGCFHGLTDLGADYGLWSLVFGATSTVRANTQDGGSVVATGHDDADYVEGEPMAVGGAWYHSELRRVYKNGVRGTADGTTNVNPSNMDVTSIGFKGVYDTAQNPPAYISEVGFWNAPLTDAEFSALGNGVRPNQIRPNDLVAYLPLYDNTKDLMGNEWDVVEGVDGGAFPNLSPGTTIFDVDEHPDMKDAVSTTYPIQQSGFRANSVDTSILHYRATRFSNNVTYQSATHTQWEFTFGGDPFYYTTDVTGITSADGNVLDSSLNTLDIWFPPYQNVWVRTRQHLDEGYWTDWTGQAETIALGYINSFDKYQILNRGSVSSVS